MVLLYISAEIFPPSRGRQILDFGAGWIVRLTPETFHWATFLLRSFVYEITGKDTEKLNLPEGLADGLGLWSDPHPPPQPPQKVN